MLKRSGYFISHSHYDKAFARRVAFWIEARGSRAWIDESELGYDGTISSTLKKAIDSCHTFIIIASKNTSKSDWVKLELKHATRKFQLNRPEVRPLFKEEIDTLKHDPLFKDRLGFDMTERLNFHKNILKIIGVTKETATCDKATLVEKLNHMKMVCPELKPLCDVALENNRIHVSQIGTLLDDKICYDDLEFCLEAGAVLAWEEQQSFFKVFAGDAFKKRGAGLAIIDQEKLAEIPRSKDSSALVYAMGNIPKTLLNCSLKILRNASPPDDQASANFINYNFESCNTNQKSQLVDIITNPPRGPGGFSRDAAFQLYRKMPDDKDLYSLWHFWIQDGDFEGRGNGKAGIRDLFNLISDDLSNGYGPWEKLLPVIINRVRTLVRRPDVGSVWKAIGYLVSASDASFPYMELIIGQLQAPCWSEWDNWADAPKMRLALNVFLKEALGDKRWGKAFDDYKTGWEERKDFRELAEKWDLDL